MIKYNWCGPSQEENKSYACSEDPTNVCKIHISKRGNASAKFVKSVIETKQKLEGFILNIPKFSGFFYPPNHQIP